MPNGSAKNDSGGDFVPIVLTKKIFKKLDKQSKGKFIPSTFSVKKLCNVGGHPEYFNQIRNRIFRELSKDSTVGDYIYLSPEDLEDVWLSWRGAFFLDEVLTGYFSTEFIQYVVEIGRDIDRSKRADYDLHKELTGMSTSDLKDFINRFDEYLPGSKTDKAKQDLKELAQTELDGRGWLHCLKRGIHI
ncbi:hypothetical protein CAFE_30830 [Caprobacter fermentans]|uniref:Uncharacterized protein n=1 Tax=Caproicibacter fermentans TaxID=2576756 RepID=A0A6N8I329_9FIRM|nr:hypothetical protein [Caproicibacter fermentans]MVB12349.1 hypothetical protein [Caproicibacter fermentans]